MNKAIQEVKRIQLADIVSTYNPRSPARGLQAGLADEGYEDCRPIDLVRQLALSDNPADRVEFCRLLEKYEGGSNGIVELAASRRVQELQPINLRSFRSHVKGTADPKVYVQRYGVISGERRLIAAAYNYAKHGDQYDTIGSLVDDRITREAAYDLAVQENLCRSDMTDIELGEVFREYRREGETLRDIAKRLNQDYQFVRGREALSYLPEKDKRAVEEGRLGVTRAIQKGLKIRQGKTNEDAVVEPKKTDRRRVATLKQVEAEFDATPRSHTNYLAALAWVMGIDITKAIKESDKRIAEAQRKAA